MAAVIGSEPSHHFHAMIANPTLQHQHSHSHDALPYRSTSRTRPSSTPRTQRPDAAAAAAAADYKSAASWESAGQSETHVSVSGGASQFPSPPPSSSPTAATGPTAVDVDIDDAKSESMASHTRDDSVPVASVLVSADPAVSQQQQPSPASDDFHIPNDSSYELSSAATPSQQAPAQTVVPIRDLAHIQSLANEDLLSGNGNGILNDQPLQQVKYEVSGMPIGDIIEMVSALLTKITTTNDLQHDAMQRNAAHQQQANQNSDSPGGSQMSPLSHSVLAFHGKNVPAITILSYLSRIHKYCPTTYEVFLSLLVYFDRMTERVNDMVAKSEAARRQTLSREAPVAAPAQQDTNMGEGESDETDSDLADDDDDEEMAETSAASSRTGDDKASSSLQSAAVHSSATYFVVDSFNIHRLIISGVTCSSKFFSDVFYTNSRYAKVGGLPLAELNHLELQFLVLNDFRLAVPVEDLEAYATMLVEFYAREVVAKKSSAASA